MPISEPDPRAPPRIIHLRSWVQAASGQTSTVGQVVTGEEEEEHLPQHLTKHPVTRRLLDSAGNATKD